MKAFTEIAFDAVRCHKEVLELRDLLAAKADLKEKKDILPFFRKRPPAVRILWALQSQSTLRRSLGLGV